MRHGVWVGMLFIPVMWLALLAQSEDYLPLTPRELGGEFRLRHIWAASRGAPRQLTTAAGSAGSAYTVTDEGLLTLAGVDRNERPWHVDLFYLSPCGVEVYEGDVDRDGVTDAVLLTYTCGNGLAPKNHIVTVSFDGSGRPVPFEAEGYSSGDDRGISALVDLDRDGRADLVFMNFDDGYWITNVYSATGGRWRRVAGRLGGRTFPLYTRFTTRPNKLPVAPAASRHPWAPDLSNAEPLMAGTLLEWEWPNGQARILDRSELDLKFTVMAVDEGRVTCTPDYWYDSARVVMDEPGGRRIVRLSGKDRAVVDPLLTRFVKDHVRVQLFGRRYRDKCSSELIWATSSAVAPAAPNQRMHPTAAGADAERPRVMRGR